MQPHYGSVALKTGSLTRTGKLTAFTR